MTGFEFEWEKTMSRGEVAALLRQIADGLDDEGEVALALEPGKLELDVPDELELELEYEAGDEETELEIELSWPSAGAGGSESAEKEPAEEPATAVEQEPGATGA